VLEKAGELKQNPNRFCQPVRRGWSERHGRRRHLRKPYRPTLPNRQKQTPADLQDDVDPVFPDCSWIRRMNQHEMKFLFELIDKHDGSLTPNMFKGYARLAVRMNKQRLGHKKRVEELRRVPENSVDLKQEKAAGLKL